MSSPTFEVYNEDFADRVVGKVSRRGIDGYLGIEVTAIGPGHLTAKFDVRPEHVTTMGTMHGGCLAALCDHVLGVVMYPVMPDGYWAATTEFKLNYLHPVKGGTCTATADIASMTRRLAVVRVEIVNEGRPVCIAQGTCTIVAPKDTPAAAPST